jgi:imidazoleglycerol-phosphate dehydratase
MADGSLTPHRTAEVLRETKETTIRVTVDVDGTGASTISTGVGFFDHMLDAFSRHAGFDMTVETKGDLHIDMHHTVEDTGIVIGQAVKQALDGFKGVRRFGHAYVPMDETLTRCAVDLCNRPYLIWKVAFSRDKIGEMDTELFKEFHQAFAMNVGACVHLETLYGDNCHHIAESGFKALARALRAAVERDPLTGGLPPSTKGVL